MDPQVSGFALGLLFGAAKIGFIGTIGFGIGWWRTHRKLRRYEESGLDPLALADRITSLERLADHTANQVDRIVEQQNELTDRIAVLNLPRFPE